VEDFLRSYQIDLNQITFHPVDYADVWMRDYGPSFLISKNNNASAWIKWKYNAYGGKFPDLLKDDQTFYALQRALHPPMFEAGIVMEGGSFDVNGSGTILTTEQCLLNPNRNPHFNRSQIEEVLKKLTGASQVIWLKRGIVNDHTDGHIDDVARFVASSTIVIACEEDRNDPNYEILEENLDILQKAMPKMFYEDHQQAPVSYANFYIANRLVLVPQFHHEYDHAARAILESFFPHHRVVGIDCRDLIYGGGTIHCITQQEPLNDSKWL
jgi:agmatine deiminase